MVTLVKIFIAFLLGMFSQIASTQVNSSMTSGNLKLSNIEQPVVTEKVDKEVFLNDIKQ